MAAVADPGLVAAHSLLERARSLASEGDFGAAADAYSRVETALHGVAGATADSPALRASWAEFWGALRQERELVAAWQEECAELASWASEQDMATPKSFSRSGSGCAADGAAAERQGPPPTAFIVDTRSYAVQELPAPRSAQQAAAAAPRDLDVWMPPEPASASPAPRGWREKADAYEQKRRSSCGPSASKRGSLSGVKPRVNTGAKRAQPSSLAPPLGPQLDLDLYSATDQELVQQLQRDVLEGVPGVSWDDIAGLESAKEVLRENVSMPLLMKDLLCHIPILRPLKGVLLFGPPGTGKTMLAKAVATAGAAPEDGCRTAFMTVSASTLASKYRGESEKLVRFLFEIARAHQPCVIFIDEIDSLCSSRGTQNEHEASRRMKTELLTQIDGMHSCSGGGPAPRVMVLAATNFPWDLDKALRRRLEKRIYIPLPQQADRVALLKLCLKGMAAAPDVNLEEIARRTEGFSGDDIANLVRSAADQTMRRIRRGRSPDAMSAAERVAMRQDIERALTLDGIAAADFAAALERSNPSCSAADVERHRAFAETYGCT